MARILIADDHDLVRDTIAAYLSRTGDLDVETSSTLSEALEAMTEGSAVDLVILDYNMPGMDGLTGLVRAINFRPDIKVALMSGVATPEVAREAMEAGAAGFFPKSLAADSMVNAVRFVLAGERYFPFGFADGAGEDRKSERYGGLSRRETQTLRELCKGKSNKEIARELDLQEVTVKLHVKNILAKMGVRNRTQAALRAREDGFT